MFNSKWYPSTQTEDHLSSAETKKESCYRLLGGPKGSDRRLLLVVL